MMSYNSQKRTIPYSLLLSDPFGAVALQFLSNSRQYLDDYDLLSNPKYLREQTKQVVMKSVLLQGLVVLTEYSKHMENQIKAQERGEDLDDYDFGPAQAVFFEKVAQLSFKSACTVVVRKIYEAICVAQLNVRLADRLTKDFVKSAMRKIAKYGSAGASSRVFFTYLWPGSLRAASFFTVDCCYSIYEYVVQKKKSKVDVVGTALWVAKRVAFHSLCMVWGGAGYALGIMVEPKVVAIWLSAIFEAGAAAVLTPLLLGPPVV
jgi:hypothetical protein